MEVRRVCCEDHKECLHDQGSIRSPVPASCYSPVVYYSQENQQQKSRKEALDSAIRKAREEAVAVDADVAHAEQELATVKASL